MKVTSLTAILLKYKKNVVSLTATMPKDKISHVAVFSRSENRDGEKNSYIYSR